MDSAAPSPLPVPPTDGGSAEDWALAYIASTDLEFKHRAPRRGLGLSGKCQELPRKPGRPMVLLQRKKSLKSPKAGALVQPKKRAQLLHSFWHHELQAAELFCWAFLRFPQAPSDFRQGLLHIARDEIRHMGMYRREIERLGHKLGDFGIRDWFWDRVPQCESPKAFVAVMGMGFEGGNLDHAARFAELLEQAGDDQAAEVQRQVGREEVAHVRFGLKWFTHFHESAGFEAWEAALPQPLSPMVMRGKPLNRLWRAKAGMNDDFLKQLSAWQPRESGS